MDLGLSDICIFSVTNIGSSYIGSKGNMRRRWR